MGASESKNEEGHVLGWPPEMDINRVRYTHEEFGRLCRLGVVDVTVRPWLAMNLATNGQLGRAARVRQGVRAWGWALSVVATVVFAIWSHQLLLGAIVLAVLLWPIRLWLVRQAVRALAQHATEHADHYIALVAMGQMTVTLTEKHAAMVATWQQLKTEVKNEMKAKGEVP